jgi:hypothetical protein
MDGDGSAEAVEGAEELFDFDGKILVINSPVTLTGSSVTGEILSRVVDWPR